MVAIRESRHTGSCILPTLDDDDDDEAAYSGGGGELSNAEELNVALPKRVRHNDSRIQTIGDPSHQSPTHRAREPHQKIPPGLHRNPTHPPPIRSS